LTISIIGNPLLDSWYGAKKAATSFKDFFVDQAQYAEFGSEYIKEYKLSNW